MKKYIVIAEVHYKPVKEIFEAEYPQEAIEKFKNKYGVIHITSGHLFEVKEITEMTAIERISEVLEHKGFTILEIKSDFGTKIVSAARGTDSGNIEIMWGENGTARVQKPNGTTKWYYEKTIPQVARALDQCIEFNTYKGRWVSSENF